MLENSYLIFMFSFPLAAAWLDEMDISDMSFYFSYRVIDVYEIVTANVLYCYTILAYTTILKPFKILNMFKFNVTLF